MSHAIEPKRRSGGATEVATLVAELVELPAYRLRDGRLTLDPEAAERDFRAHHRARADEAPDVVAALLRLPIEPPVGRSTPARTDYVSRLAAAGLVPAAVAGELVDGGRVSEPEWAELRRLIDLVEPEASRLNTTRLDRWRVTFECADGSSLELPRLWDPLAHPEGWRPPLEALEDLLASLEQAGWRRGGVEETWTEADEPAEDLPNWVGVSYMLVR